MSKVGLIMIATGIYFMLCGLNLALNRPRIERDLTLRTQQALSQQNLPVKQVKFTGRDGLIDLDTSDGEVRNKVQRVAQRVFGVRVIASAPVKEKPPSLRIERNGEKVVMTGLVHDQSIRGKLVVGLSGAFGAANVGETLQVTSDVSAPAYLEKAIQAFALLVPVKTQGRWELEGDDLTLRGSVPDAATKAGIEKDAKSLVPSELHFHDQVAIVEPKPTPSPTPTPSPSLTPTSEARVPQAVPGTPPPAPPSPKAPHASRNLERELDSRNLNFFFDSVRIVPGGEPRVPELVALLKQHPGKRIRIVGYADGTGPKDYNLKLSSRRAKAVLALLVKKGVSAARIVTEGRGATEFVADNATSDGRAQNRRVEFHVMAG